MTEEIEAIAKRLVVDHKRDGRSIYDQQARSELVRACRQPGISLARVARTCGINANVLSNWVRLHERGKGGGAAANLGREGAINPSSLGPAEIPDRVAWRLGVLTAKGFVRRRHEKERAHAARLANHQVGRHGAGQSEDHAGRYIPFFALSQVRRALPSSLHLPLEPAIRSARPRRRVHWGRRSPKACDGKDRPDAC